MSPETTRVFLVGAGPGHPGLLTLRGLECLRQADLVLYDKLVPAALLEHAAAAAVKLCVADLAGQHAEGQVPIHEAMITAAGQGKIVVRLKGGDPCLFGRGGEEAQALHRAGIPFEIVPGVTAALGAAGFAGIPLTHRQHAGAVAFVTGHDDAHSAESSLDWASLARFPGTLVIYMGMSRLDKLAPALIAGGKQADTPAAAIHGATTGEQRSVVATLGELPALVRAAGLTAPALLIVGSVVSLRDELNWFEKLPLFGKRVLVTRPRRQAGDLAHRLALRGAAPRLLPAVDIREPTDWRPVDDALDKLATYQWLVFTSANGVDHFMKRLWLRKLDARALGAVKVAAIGPKTAEALEEYRVRADLVPDNYQSEHLAAALAEKLARSDRLLLARADRGRDVLPALLSKICTVDEVAVYSQVDAAPGDSPVLDELRRGEIDFVIITSANIGRAFFRMLDATCRARLESGQTRLVSISPVTSAEIRAGGLAVAAEATCATTEGVIEAIEKLAAKDEGR